MSTFVSHTGRIQKRISLCYHNLSQSQFTILSSINNIKSDEFPKPLSKKKGIVNYHKFPKHSCKHSQPFSSLTAAQPDREKNYASLDVHCDFFKGSFRELAAFVLQFLYGALCTTFSHCVLS